jgi:predicted dehydrogenase
MNPTDSAKPMSLNRREFLSASVLAGTSLLVGSSAIARAGEAPVAATFASRRKRYAIVGVGSRHEMYRHAITKTFAPHAELVALCDLNEGRLKLSQKRSGLLVPLYLSGDFDRMVKEARPDTIIVTTKDCTHDQYIIRGMKLGCDIVTEKPMTMTELKCQAILKTQKKTGRRCTVTFNYRYSPPRTQVKDLLMSGVIGDVLSVDFHWMLDTQHGADYFRRWHSHKANSGGLMVHKATHHFDLVNWWLSAIPVSVMASGKREFYTPKMANRLGLEGYHERCHTCPEHDKCGFYLDLAANASLRALYLDNEKYDRYFRDRCVWRPEIDIEDTMNVMVRYNTGATLSYSLNAFNAWEGYCISFNGTKGRLEHKVEESLSISGDGSVPGAIKGDGTYIRIFPLRKPAYEVALWKGEGAHGGGDALLLRDIFLPEEPKDKYLRAADQRSGAHSLLVGVAANKSFVSGRAVEIDGLVSDIGMPDYPLMPAQGDSVPMPAKS